MRVIAATGNKGKLREFARIFAPLGIEVRSQGEACPGLSVEESGTSFAENAFQKAEAVHRLTGEAAVSDDSGLCIDALGGAPGVYSARYFGEETPYNEKIGHLLEALREVPDEQRAGRFVAHICYISADGERIDVEECCEGRIGHAPRGENGFGYDPVFMVGEQSFSELDDSKKDEISHRGKALRELARRLKSKKENQMV